MFLEDRRLGAKPCSTLGTRRLEELIRAPEIHSETLKQTQLNTKPSLAPCECLCPRELLSISVQAARELPSWCRRSLLAPFIADNPAPLSSAVQLHQPEGHYKLPDRSRAADC